MNAYIESRLSREWNAAALEEIAQIDPDFDRARHHGFRPLQWLLHYNERGLMHKAIETLLHRGARVDFPCDTGFVPLSYAANLADFDLLVRYGADVTLVRDQSRQWVWEAGGDGGSHGFTHHAREVKVMVLASPRLCEDLARTIIELTQ